MRARALCMLVVMTLGVTVHAQPSETLFPRPESLKPAIEFWTRVYTEVDTQSGFIHDNLHLDVIYETVHFDDGASSRQRNRITSRATDKYREILNKLGSGNRENLNAEELRVLQLWPDDVTNAELTAAAHRLRFQLGQSDRFRAGLVRSGAWKPYILKVLDEQGLPPELAALPHVESSFDPTAYSRVGAAGMWQFTRSTGLRYLQIDHIVDERRDPFISTSAAIRLLADNYAVIPSWPVAITAYNHGLASMRRAVDELGTTDIGVIVEKYDGRSFGFASRNFYAAFLAALDVDTNASKYFGDLKIDKPEQRALVTVPDYIDADTLADALGLRRSELQALNPALMETVWEGDKFIPKGFELRLAGIGTADAEQRLHTIPATARFAAQRPDVYHRVRSGDTLSQIASRYGVSVSALVRVNNLRSRNFIRVGQTLTLPVAGGTMPPTLAQAGEAGPATIDESGEYIVRRGDTVDVIARRLGVSIDELVAANQLSNRNLIYPGQTLQVPGVSAPRPVAAIPVAAIPVEAVTVETLAVDHDSLEPAVGKTQSAAQPPPGIAAIAAVADTGVEPTGLEFADLEALDDSVSIPLRAGQTPIDDDAEADGGVLASVQQELAADPSDYTVADDGTIEVQALETLGHYADWLEIRTQRLRDINHMPFSEAVVIGHRIRLDFSKVDALTFEQRREAYQRERQESFFSAYRIEDTVDHVIQPGESLWVLTQRTYNVPVWLVRQYNPDLDLDRLSPGTVVKFPRLRRIAEPTSAAAG